MRSSFFARRSVGATPAGSALVLVLALVATACTPLPAQDGGYAAATPVSPAELRQAQAQADLAEVKRRLAIVEGRDDTKALDELRALRGEVERLRYQTESDTRRDRTQLDSLDRRVGLLESAVEELRRSGGGYGRSPAAYVAPASEATTTVTTPAAPVAAPAPALSLPRPGDAEPVSRGVAVPVLPAEPTPTVGVPRASTDPAAEEALYMKGIETAKAGDYAGAQRIFAAVASTYPQGAYADDAWYWHGEMAFAQRDYRGAHAAYQTLIERFPESPKLPEALYKMGQCYGAMGQTAEAGLLYRRVVRDYPNTAAGRGAQQKLGN